MAQTTAQKLETTNCRKIDNRNSNSSANTDIYAYSETMFCVATVGYGMTENWTYGFAVFEKMWVIVIWDTHYMDTKKQCSESVLWTILKHYWNEFQ